MGEDMSIMDLTVDILVERQRWTKDELRKRFKKTKPFRMEPVSDNELIKRYDSMTQEQWAELMNTHSQDEVEGYKNEMENMKIRRGDYA